MCSSQKRRKNNLEKLFYVSYSYILYGYCYTWITHKEKPVEAEIHSDSFFIKSKENKLEEALTEQIQKDVEHYKNKISTEGRIYLYDWSSPFIEEKRIEKIENIKLKDYTFREATISECMEQLTPKEYSKMYGKILKMEAQND